MTVNVHRVRAWGWRSTEVTFCKSCEREIVTGKAGTGMAQGPVLTPECLLTGQGCAGVASREFCKFCSSAAKLLGWRPSGSKKMWKNLRNVTDSIHD